MLVSLACLLIWWFDSIHVLCEWLSAKVLLVVKLTANHQAHLTTFSPHSSGQIYILKESKQSRHFQMLEIPRLGNPLPATWPGPICLLNLTFQSEKWLSDNTAALAPPSRLDERHGEAVINGPRAPSSSPLESHMCSQFTRLTWATQDVVCKCLRLGTKEFLSSKFYIEPDVHITSISKLIYRHFIIISVATCDFTT